MENLQNNLEKLETMSINGIREIINELIHTSNMLLLSNNDKNAQNIINLSKQIKQLIPIRDEYTRLNKMKSVPNEKLLETERKMRIVCLECLQNINEDNFINS
jgi:hypothetical protein